MKQVYLAAVLLVLVMDQQAQGRLVVKNIDQQPEMEENSKGNLLKIEDTLEQKNNKITYDHNSDFVKCEELGGMCLDHHQVKNCYGDLSTDNDGKCFDKKMVCCAPETYSSEGGWSPTEGTYNSGSSGFSEGTEAPMGIDDLLMFTDEPGKLLKIEDTLEQKNKMVTMWFDHNFDFVCEELGGMCLDHDQVKNCYGDLSTDNDGKCFDNMMVCCAPETYSFEGGWSPTEGTYNSGTSGFTEDTEATMGPDDLLMSTDEPGNFLKIEDKLVQNSNKFNPIIKCGELGGMCLHIHEVEHCYGDLSTDNDGKCFYKKMVCCAPKTYSSEGGWSPTEGTYNSGSSGFTEGAETTMGTPDGLLMFTDKPGKFLKKSEFVKCGELGGKCLPHHEVNHCYGDLSTNNDGKCFHKNMVCCAPETYSSEGGWSPTEGMYNSGTSGFPEDTEATMTTDDLLMFGEPAQPASAA